MTLHQATRGFHRLVVLFVERWAVLREPTQPAQQALAEAYVHLCLLDRAFSRVEALVARPDAPAAVWRLGVQILRMRGWLDEATSFARRAEKALPDGATLSVLVDRASEPWVPDPVPEGDATSLAVRRAERAMREGQFVRAQVELQRLRRQQGRRIERVDELLWAIRGDFVMEAEIDQLVPLLVPRPESSDTLVPVEDDGLGGQASTEAFRQLFRNLDVTDEGFDPELEEDTHLTEMAELVQRYGQGLDSDHQVARVLQRNGASDPDALESVLEGRLGDRASSDYARPDHLEDDSIVVVTRRESFRDAPVTQPFAAEVARVTLDARQEAVAREELADAPGGDFLRPSPAPAPPRFRELLGARLREEGRSLAFWAGGAAVLMFFGIVMLGLAAWVATN